MKYKCENCGQEHEGWPALTFKTPYPYYNLSDEDKTRIATIDSNFCVITHQDQTDRYIRCVLTQTVNDHCQDLDYGIWISLSEKSFNDYQENFGKNHETSYFGWFCSKIPEYKNMLSIPTTAFTQTGGQRPLVVPHKDFDHPFVKDYYNGISKAEAEKRIADMVENTREKSEEDTKKPDSFLKRMINRFRN